MSGKKRQDPARSGTAGRKPGDVTFTAKDAKGAEGSTDNSGKLRSGIEAARRILGNLPSRRILFITQECSTEVVEEALRAGGRGYVAKADGGRESLMGVDTILPESLQFLFLDSELGEAAVKAHEQFGKDPDNRFLQTVKAGKMNCDFGIEQALGACMA